MLIPVPPSECMRARETVSSRLDGELSELEAARLDVHLRRCAACREFVAAAGAIALELRSAPLERPTVPAFEPRRRRPASMLRVQAAAAAAVVAAVGGSFALGRTLGTGGSAPAFTASAPTFDLSSARSDSFDQHLRVLLPPVNRMRSLRADSPVAL